MTKYHTAFSLDFDGCMDKFQESTRLPKAQKILFDHLTSKIIDVSKTFIGSNRQSVYLDLANEAHNKNGLAIDVIPFIAKAIGSEFCPLVLADFEVSTASSVLWNSQKQLSDDQIRQLDREGHIKAQSPGYGFTHYIDDTEIPLVHPLSGDGRRIYTIDEAKAGRYRPALFDKYKTEILRRQIAHMKQQMDESDVLIFYFYDDKKEILDKLAEYFNIPGNLPPGVILMLTEFNSNLALRKPEEEVLSHAHDRLPIVSSCEQFEIVKANADKLLPAYLRDKSVLTIEFSSMPVSAEKLFERVGCEDDPGRRVHTVMSFCQACLPASVKLDAIKLCADLLTSEESDLAYKAALYAEVEQYDKSFITSLSLDTFFDAMPESSVYESLLNVMRSPMSLIAKLEAFRLTEIKLSREDLDEIYNNLFFSIHDGGYGSTEAEKTDSLRRLHEISPDDLMRCLGEYASSPSYAGEDKINLIKLYLGMPQHEISIYYNKSPRITNQKANGLIRQLSAIKMFGSQIPPDDLSNFYSEALKHTTFSFYDLSAIEDKKTLKASLNSIPEPFLTASLKAYIDNESECMHRKLALMTFYSDRLSPSFLHDMYAKIFIASDISDAIGPLSDEEGEVIDALKTIPMTYQANCLDRLIEVEGKDEYKIGLLPLCRDAFDVSLHAKLSFALEAITATAEAPKPAVPIQHTIFNVATQQTSDSIGLDEHSSCDENVCRL